jgi:Pyruvate/2-oxoacid:ferredoxin oxidoreductase gamma subunit
MTGFFCAVTGLLDPDALRKAVADSVPASMRKLNIEAFDRGLAYGTNLKASGHSEGEPVPSMESV